MRIDSVHVQNFRLLRDVEICLEQETTVVVGRNNSGKTSLTELFRRFLATSTPTFRLEDFPAASHESFWNAYLAVKAGKDDEAVRVMLPSIRMTLTVDYDGDFGDLGPLAPFVIDLTPTCTQAQIEIRYQLRPGAVKKWFSDLRADPDPDTKDRFYRLFKVKLLRHYETVVEAVDPSDDTNRRPIDFARLRELLLSGFVNAQRHLDDTTQSDKNVLGKIVEVLFREANADAAEVEEALAVQKLHEAIEGFQIKIDEMANELLEFITSALGTLGYPGLGDPGLRTETNMDMQGVVSNYTRVCYQSGGGMNLPETYNGLGSRNLIFMLLRIMEFWRAFRGAEKAPGLHIVFIEEPEVHFHPQMAQVFIKQLQEIKKKVTRGQAWPVQFVVTTHSSHVANDASFEAIRYFLKRPDPALSGAWLTDIKDLRRGFKAHELKETVKFLQQYLTQTRCDLFFADKAILIEGTCERLLLPRMMEKADAAAGVGAGSGLVNQYITIMEVGGAYAQKFLDLIDFLELQTLIVTDIDTVKRNKTKHYEACIVSDAESSSNECLKDWFKDDQPHIPTLLARDDDDKIHGRVRIAYQVPESSGAGCGRTLEDAFVLANLSLFQQNASPPSSAACADIERWARSIADKTTKAAFALHHAIDVDSWTVPRYIREGLTWLSKNLPPPAAAASVGPAVAGAATNEGQGVGGSLAGAK